MTTEIETVDAVEARNFLVGSLGQRWRPEDTVQYIDALIGQGLPEADRLLLLKARPRWRYSSMPTEFTQAASLAGKEAAISHLAKELEKSPNRSRLRNRKERLERALEKRRADWRRRIPLLAQFAETAFAPRLATEAETYLNDDRSLCFVAWLTARMGMRSVFTNTKQAKPFDTIAEMLLRNAMREGREGEEGGERKISWFAIACVFPRADVLANLTREEKLTLLDASYAVLGETAEYLRKVSEDGSSDFNLDTMIVHKGDDSSSWNALAGAWNRARDWWFASLESLGWIDILDTFCPGKVLRMMAGDVVFWHTGGTGVGGRNSVEDSLHPDTKVWRDLPKPWLVLNTGGVEKGDDKSAVCTAQMVTEACERYGVDPTKSGWVYPRARVSVEAFHPTPELVYGVEVGHPALAAFLRRLGVFSGKGLKK